MTTLNARLYRHVAALTLAALAAGLPLVASSATQGEKANASSNQQPNDGSDYVAAWTVMGEICYDQYPQMKPAIDEFWTTRWDKATRERVANMKQGPDFQAKVAKHRKNLAARKDEILAQCGKLFMGGAH